MQTVDILLEEVIANPCVDKPHHGAVSAEQTQNLLDALQPFDTNKAQDHGAHTERSQRCPVNEATGEEHQHKEQHPCELRLRHQACQPMGTLTVGTLAEDGAYEKRKQAVEIEHDMIKRVVVDEERREAPAHQEDTDEVEHIRP